LIKTHTLQGPRSGRVTALEEVDNVDERVAQLQDIVAMLLEKNEQLRQQLSGNRADTSTN
jgi:hypothetical protein